MPLLDYLDLLALQRKFEQGDSACFHELSGERPALQAGKLLLYEPDILRCLYDTDLIFSTLGLHGNYVVTSPFIDADVKLIDLYLADSFDSCSKVIL